MSAATICSAVWRAAYRQARRQLRPSPRYTVGARFPWTMDAIRNRFGASGYAVAQQAVRLAFDRATACRGATGTVAQLQRQGLVDRAGRPSRAATVERFLGGYLAWSFDTLGDVNGRRADRAYRARQLREQRAEDAARRRAIARDLAADRRSLERGEFFALTPAGKAALAAAAHA